MTYFRVIFDHFLTGFILKPTLKRGIFGEKGSKKGSKNGQKYHFLDLIFDPCFFPKTPTFHARFCQKMGQKMAKKCVFSLFVNRILPRKGVSSDPFFGVFLNFSFSWKNAKTPTFHARFSPKMGQKTGQKTGFFEGLDPKIWSFLTHFLVIFDPFFELSLMILEKRWSKNEVKNDLIFGPPGFYHGSRMTIK